MKTQSLVHRVGLLLSLTAAFCGAGIGNVKAAEQSVRTAKPVDFAREVLPILSDKCFVCHGPDSTEEGQLRLDTFEAATQVRSGYQAINPTSPEQSELLARIHSVEEPMPPADAEKQLTLRERDVLTRWVKQGGTYAMHWAFVRPQKVAPMIEDASIRNKVDAFLLTKMRAEGAAFAVEADRRILARRAALTLTGLPPEPQQLDRFLADLSDDAYEKLVDELMMSPRFGEHQARYWLDAVRYGDTHGLHLDNRRGIYPYRDWVVRALNQNLPLDQFITWQLAGDLLAEPTLEQKIATGYVRLNPSTGEGGAIPAEFQMKNNFDRVETLGTVFLGMSLTCARCHTHKYDPIPQTEYYRLLAFFNSTAEPSMDGNKYEYGPVAKVPKDHAAWSEWSLLLGQRRSLIRQVSNHLEKGDSIAEATFKKWQASSDADRLVLLTSSEGELTQLKLTDQAVELKKKIEQAEAAFTTTLVAQDLPQPRNTHVLKRGEYDLPIGEPLQPGILEVMGDLPEAAPRNRLGLAQWLTSREHPLVARVLINRVWQRVFGYGLVRTPEDFGLQGQQPTHPELLDWLAVELQDSGWDLKHMLRLMVTSRAFRQSSAWRDDVSDPENLLFARGPGYRLDAEVLRDVALWASGLLDPSMGGEGVKPYQPVGMWKALAHPGSNTKEYVADKGQLLYRRSFYVYWKRTSPHPMMTLFDAPDRESSCVRRSRTNTSLQSLGLLNETQRIEMSRKLAERLLLEADSDVARLNLLFELLASRNPTDRESVACRNLLAVMRQRFQASPNDALALLSQGEAARNEKLDPAELAAWTQVAVTVLASDVAILLY
ncbi:MAG: PSD1 and planctomycete cytochrome C domain-containing protein [Planctomycetota bacterium]|nr:PSD1 and planctomycete cytochrome C domain-containing protein [Planctomycetota bacterium]MDA0921109.1 PSD1 and planctomycete cytochrome C domain-containing protein [Planctomycetota bacterium]